MPDVEQHDDDLTFSKDLYILPIPKHLRYDPSKPPKLTILMNITFGLSTTFTVANLYYTQPILVALSEAFDQSYARTANIPTLSQAGYAAGLLLISPLGDMVRRRQLILGLLLCSTLLTIGCAITKSFEAFEALQFLIGFITQLPQILIPLAADIAPPEKRAQAIAIIMSGLLAGIFVARVLAGILAQYKGYEAVYWLALALQGSLCFLLYFVLPDFPAKGRHLKYWQIYTSMAKYAVTEPILIQACFIGICTSAIFAGFWTSLTFLLDQIYHYNTLQIGLFGIIGLAGVLAAPLVGSCIDRMSRWIGILIGLIFTTISMGIYTGTAGLHVAAVIIVAFIFDVAHPLQQISNTSRVAGIEPAARGRLNSVLIVAIFCGQIAGTQSSSIIYLKYGYHALGGLFCGYAGFALLVLLLRGPNEYRHTWLGYKAGFDPRSDAKSAPSTETKELSSNETESKNLEATASETKA